MTPIPLSLINGRRRQRGDFFIEALISIALMSIVVVGSLYMSTRAMVAQRNMRMQEVAIDQMRSALMANKSGGSDLCTGIPEVTLPDGTNLTVTVTGCNLTTSVVVNGVTVDAVPVPLSLSVDSELVGGLLRVGSTWETL